jgi:hypothetical protein
MSPGISAEQRSYKLAALGRRLRSAGRRVGRRLGSSFFIAADNFSILSVPRDLAAEPVSVLVKDPERLHRALVPMLNSPQYSPDLFVDRARAQVRRKGPS